MSGGNNHDFRTVAKAWFVQKIIGVNRSVPWPVHWTTKIIEHENINRGNRTPGLSYGCHIDGRNGIDFGENVWIGPYVSIISQNHDCNQYDRYLKCNSIEIGNNCWLGAHSIILPSVRLGNHVVVGAGSVVTKSFEEDDIVIAGNPAKIVKKLPSYSKDKK